MTKIQRNKPLIRVNLILSDPEEEEEELGETFFKVRGWERVSVISELSKRRQLYYTVDIRRLYPNTLTKFQLILRRIGNNESGVLLIVFMTLQIVPICRGVLIY